MTETAKTLSEKLKAPFRADEIEWRVDRGVQSQKGNFVFVLAYVSNRAIQNRLDETFGPFGWKNDFREWKEGNQICAISVKDPETGEWICKEDGSDNSNMEAVKGGLSNAMKRAAVQWGIGRYLYKLEQTMIPLKDSGQHYAQVKVKSNGNETYIKGYWDEPKLPAWALPAGDNGQQKAAPPAQPTTEQPTAPQQPAAKPAAASNIGQQAGNTIIPSGKHKGKMIHEAPLDWVEWYVSEGPNTELKKACQVFLQQSKSQDSSIPPGINLDDLPNV